VFAYYGLTHKHLIDAITSNGWEELFDLVCILQRGVLMRRLSEDEGLLDWNEEGPFAFIRGKAASLAFMYYYLVSYGSRFQVRVFDFTRYIEPLGFWRSTL
jgi:hypothetical protein